MEFQINKFANEFKNTVDWMLRSNHGEEIKDGLRQFKINKNLLENDPDSKEALAMIIKLVKTSGFRLKPRNFDKRLDSFIKEYGENFRTPQARDELITLVGNRKRKNVELLLSYPSLKLFTNNLYALSNQGKTEVLGEKGRDNYLRDFGYWDRIPIDIHEMRFIIRSGIYHSFSGIDKSDHLRKSDLHDALARFCRTCLKGYHIEGIDLGNAPGIVDGFIWSFSAKDIYNMCGVAPKCQKCGLCDACLFSLANDQI